MSDDFATQLAEDFTAAIKRGDFDDEITDFMETTVVDTWVSLSPEDSGDYKRSIRVLRPALAGQGRVGATEGYGNIIEFGSSDTPEFAPRQRTVDQLNADRPAQ